MSPQKMYVQWQRRRSTTHSSNPFCVVPKNSPASLIARRVYQDVAAGRAPEVLPQHGERADRVTGFRIRDGKNLESYTIRQAKGVVLGMDEVRHT